MSGREMGMAMEAWSEPLLSAGAGQLRLMSNLCFEDTQHDYADMCVCTWASDIMREASVFTATNRRDLASKTNGRAQHVLRDSRMSRRSDAGVVTLLVAR